MKNANLALKQTIKKFRDELRQDFIHKAQVTTLVHKLSLFIDKQLISLFNKNQLDQNNQFCLIALGSYGRRELHLYSDIDILLLHNEAISQQELNNAQKFISDCWDVGLEVGHQITTVTACSELASKDVSVISSIMDHFLICGSSALLEELIFQTKPLNMWSSADYFFAKQQEQKKRYEKYGETAYNLEPNVKNGPGGLRDLQVLLSISKRHFNIKNLAEGISYGFITDKEYEELIYCQHVLWRVRFGLHVLADKPEERLSFDYQIKLAALFGYVDQEHSLAIEQFMKHYFKVIKRTRELNEMLIQWFNETIVHQQKQTIIHLDEEFQLANNYIEVCHEQVFSRHPQALLRLFLWIVKRPDIEGIRADTIRLLRQSLYLMNDRFKQDPATTATFMSILRQQNQPYEALQRMNRFGVLAHYLDCFAAVTGQMQYDLFHAFTVEQHTLFVIRNISRFTQDEYAQQFPLCHSLMQQLKKPELLYLGALFHDISKGQGGDHSELGAIEAEQFALRHNLNQDDRQLLQWLVRHHLLMSHTAQRQDIYDPKTIENFANNLPEPKYLDYLYLLTVADICGTNPNLWNAWKDSLLKEVYNATKHLISKQQKRLDENAIINSKKEEALQLLLEQKMVAKNIRHLWSQLKGKYFLYESSEVIARHTKAILTCEIFPLILIMPHHSQGGTEVFIYMPHRDARFTVATSVLSNHHVTIQEAHIMTCDNDFDLDTYVILDENNQAFLDMQRTQAIELALYKELSNPVLPKITRKRVSRALAHFKVTTQISYSESPHSVHTRLFLVTNDRPGLLASISHIFLEQKIHLHNAKIATAGERAEDTFYITNAMGQGLSPEEKDSLRKKLIQGLGCA